MSAARVAVVMGSLSDFDVMVTCVQTLQQLQITYEVRVLSAHRTPDQVAVFAAAAQQQGLQVIVAGAGGAAHLAGALAAHTPVPVIGVPLAASTLAGLDALLATVQMPAGVPVATVGIGRPGAINAAHLAARILAVRDAGVGRRVREVCASQAAKVASTAQQELQRRLAELGL